MSHYSITEFMRYLKETFCSEIEFHQAVQEVVTTLIPFINENPRYQNESILERLVTPERTIIFRVCWEDDKHNIQVNNGYRVQFNSVLGPYKGGLRFHPTVNLSTFKFLGFEQIIKNSLTGLQLGGGKGGSDFDPKGKSDREVMRFCQAFMNELHRYIGPEIDVPAGDIGVGAREIAYLFGQYKKLTKDYSGVLTGKGLSYGGSLLRPEATGYGCVYFGEDALKQKGSSMEGMRIALSGSGNVAQFAAEKAMSFGARIITLSDSSGTIYHPQGINREQLEYIKEIKNVGRHRISQVAEHYPEIEFKKGAKPWNLACDIAFPCATQNEIGKEDAEKLIKNKCRMILEGANMPCTPAATELFVEAEILYIPSKAANAGGVAVSGLEMSQNAQKMHWTAEEVDKKLQDIMSHIHDQCLEFGKKGNQTDYIKGANIAGFVRVAETMIGQGI